MMSGNSGTNDNNTNSSTGNSLESSSSIYSTIERAEDGQNQMKIQLATSSRAKKTFGHFAKYLPAQSINIHFPSNLAMYKKDY